MSVHRRIPDVALTGAELPTMTQGGHSWCRCESRSDIGPRKRSVCPHTRRAGRPSQDIAVLGLGQRQDAALLEEFGAQLFDFERSVGDVDRLHQRRVDPLDRRLDLAPVACAPGGELPSSLSHHKDTVLIHNSDHYGQTRSLSGIPQIEQCVEVAFAV